MPFGLDTISVLVGLALGIWIIPLILGLVGRRSEKVAATAA